MERDETTYNPNEKYRTLAEAQAAQAFLQSFYDVTFQALYTSKRLFRSFEVVPVWDETFYRDESEDAARKVASVVRSRRSLLWRGVGYWELSRSIGMTLRQTMNGVSYLYRHERDAWKIERHQISVAPKDK